MGRTLFKYYHRPVGNLLLRAQKGWMMPGKKPKLKKLYLSTCLIYVITTIVIIGFSVKTGHPHFTLGEEH
jgi:hypothetical protein